jgi:putative tryptophan/tyrosine transport system substrate-binding protein
MKRRDFAAGLLLAAAARPVFAQLPGKRYRIAVVSAAIPAATITEAEGGTFWQVFYQELRRLGFVEGSNLVVERYSAEGHQERYPEIAREVVSRNPDLIVAATGFLGIAFRNATTDIPIVATMADPIKWGLVTSLAKPGGNLTGVSVDAGIEVHGKRLQIMKEALPALSTVGFLAMRASWEGAGAEQFRQAGRQLGISVTGMLLDASTPSEYQRVFAVTAQTRPDAIAVSEAGDLLPHRQLIVDLAAKSRVPAMYPYRDYVGAGGLMAYATDLAEAGRQIAKAAGQVLGGTKPGDIPIYQATKFEFIVNQRTAHALGLAFPPALLARADEVIE